jgi:hypothetical protein
MGLFSAIAKIGETPAEFWVEYENQIFEAGKKIFYLFLSFFLYIF